MVLLHLEIQWGKQNGKEEVLELVSDVYGQKCGVADNKLWQTLCNNEQNPTSKKFQLQEREI